MKLKCKDGRERGEAFAAAFEKGRKSVHAERVTGIGALCPYVERSRKFGGFRRGFINAWHDGYAYEKKRAG